MHNTALDFDARSIPARGSRFLSRILVCCLDVQAVWSIGHDPLACEAPWEGHDLLVFADRLALQRLRATDSLHRADMQLLVVLDGDQFENAWGPQRLTGSLARWAWRPAHDVAFYDESRWAEREGASRAVARVRRKAFLVWPSEFASS